MIYLAARSAWKYLQKLEEISNRPEENHIVSITGGLAFFHAVSERTQSLVLIDSDPEVTAYAQSMIEIIICCRTRDEFFGLLSGRNTYVDQSGYLSFSKQHFERRSELLKRVSASSRLSIERWYPEGQFVDETATLEVDDKVVHFRGLSLQHNHFNWHADWGCFRTEESYQNLSQRLSLLEPQFLTMALEEYDFSKCPRGTLVLASNTDSPLFTQRDIVLSAVESSAIGRCAYISRTRDFTRPSPPYRSIQFEKMSLPPILVGVPDKEFAVFEVLIKNEWRQLSYEQYYAEFFYDQELLVYWLGDGDSDSSSAIIKHLIDHQPIHQRVGIACSLENNVKLELIAIFRRYQFQEEIVLGNSKLLIFSLSCRTPYSSP